MGLPNLSTLPKSPTRRQSGFEVLTGSSQASAAQLVIRPYDDSFRTRWDSFVSANFEGTLFHSLAWKRAIERSFGFESRYLVAEQDQKITGVLPLFLTSNWIQGRTLISTPFAVYGGICAGSGPAREALADAACRTADEERVNYLEFREPRGELGSPFLTKKLYVTFEQPLCSDPEKIMSGFSKDTRYMIRKGQKNGLTSVADNNLLDVFYDIYAESVRNLGTPVFPKRFFAILLEELGDAAKMIVIRRGSQALATAMCFFSHDSVTPYYVGATGEGRPLAVYNFLFWEIIRSACEAGLRSFDFGRTKLGTGSYAFKTKWNMRPRPLPYQYYLVKRKSLPNFSPANPKFRIATTIWKRIPLPVSKALGPPLVRLFP